MLLMARDKSKRAPNLLDRGARCVLMFSSVRYATYVVPSCRRTLWQAPLSEAPKGFQRSCFQLFC